jgi:hypothetical protein
MSSTARIPSCAAVRLFAIPALWAVALAGHAHAQSVTDPRITSWQTAKSAQYARVYESAAKFTAGTTNTTWPTSGLVTNPAGGVATAAYSDVQRVAYSATYVYIQTTGLASYTMGNWLTPNGTTYTSFPSNRAAIHRIPRTPSIPTTKQKNNGSGGVLVNGVYVWQNGDAQSYANASSTAATATISMSGDGIWNRLAGVAEAFNFDPAYGHQPNNGAYHNHINPIALRYQLGDNVTYSAATKTYAEAAPTRHSPIIGWANDGLPIYGPYGYSSAMDATSAVRRMTTGFTKRDGTLGTVNLAITGRTTLPVWAASVQGKSQTLTSSQYGPTTTATYALGPVNKTCVIGTFAEDYEYLGDLGKVQGVDFDLNRQNVRFCVTPEFPAGTYAYFTCIDASGATVFPDVINQEYFGTASPGQGTVTSISETVTDYVAAGPAAAIALTGAASGANVLLSWNSAEGATYKVESSADNTTFATLSSAVTSAGLTTTYTATGSTNYYRVTLTAISSYDTGGTYGTPVGTTKTLAYGTVAAAPAITTQPASQTVATGASVTFTVVASGTAPLTYQWSKNSAAISGATSASYAIASAAAADVASYTVTVTNSAGSATSNAATLTVTTTPAATAPVITTPPASQSVLAGASVTFAVVASGTAPLTYQWSKNSSAISGATSTSYTIASAAAADAGSYTVVVTNGAGSVTSAAAVLTLTAAATPPAIASAPASQTVVAGAGVTFTVAASGTAPFAYQWSKNGASISGATAASYSIAATTAADAGSFTVVVTNSAGSATSAAAILTVSAAAAVAPSIVTQPANITVGVGGNATFTVVASGTAPLTYQWRKNGVAISGASAASYALTSVSAADAGSYSVVITNSAGSTASNVATLIVEAPVPLAARLINLAVRAPVSATAGAPIVGFVLGGTGPGKRMLVRVAGPALTTFGVAGALADPRVSIVAGATSLGFNDNWLAADAAVMAGVGAFPFTTGSRDAAVVSTLAPGPYTAPVDAPVGTEGVVLVECYDGAPTDTAARLINASTRAFVGTGESVLIPGFVISGTGTVKLLLRAAGPALTAFGVTGTLADPQLSLFSAGNSTALATNDNWSSAANAAAITAAAANAGAFAFTVGSRDAAVLVDLSAGNYTATVSGVGGITGTALVEIYVVQ